MANEFAHKSVGSSMTQAEYESIGGHVLDSQATGDIVYATSSSQLSRLGIGATGAVLTVTGGVPAWDTTWTPTGALIPASDDTYDLGSASAAWQDLFLEGDISFTDGGNITFTPSTDDTVVMTASTNGAFSLVTTDTAAAAANIQITADGTVDIDSAGVLTLDSGAAINIEPASGSAILLDGTISIDAGVVTGATSITSENVTITSDIAVDGISNLDNTDIDGTLVVDGTNISLDSTTTLNIDNSNTSNGITIGTATASVPITIGHGTSTVTIGDDLTVTGDLTVSGTTTTVTSTTVAIADSMLLLAKDQGTSADAVDFGFYGKYGVGGTAKYAGIFRDLSATGDPWTFFDELQAEPGTTVNTAGTGYDLADISAGAITSADGFSGDLTGNVTGNASGTAATVTGGTQASITTVANVVEVGALDAGSITSGFTSIDVGAGAITTTGALSIASMGTNWTNAGRTVADMGIATTIDINGGTIDGAVIGGAATAAITGTAVTGTSIVGGTVAGTTAAFSGLISANGGITFAAGDDIAFTGTTGTNDIVLTNGLADALSITDGSADVIAISTAGGTNTVALTGDLTVSGTIAADTAIGDGSGLVVGHTAQLTVQGLVPELQVLGTGNEDGSLLLASFGAVIPRLHLARSESTSVGTFTNALDANDDIGEIVFVGSDGTDFEHPAVKIIAAADAQMSSNDVPGRLEFWTAADGGTTLTERMRLDSTGAIGIAGANFGTDGQVLTSGGTGAAVAWEDAAGGGTASWDAVVSASGADYATIQAADDALDSATTGYSLFVKGQQEYAEDVTISTDGVYIFIEGTTTLDGQWVISGDNCHVVVGPGAIIEGNWTISGAGNTVEFGGGFLWTGDGTMSGAGNTLRLGADSDHVGINTMSGAEGSIYCGNGVETDGLVVTANSCLFDGGGFYTTIDGGTARSAVTVTAGHGFRISNCAVENTRDQGNAYDGIRIQNSAVFKIDNIHVHQSDQNGFNIQSDTGVTRGQISNVYMDACNDAMIYIDMNRVVMQNVMGSDGKFGITIAADGDNSSILGCHFQNMSESSPINIDTNAENCVVVGNRVDGTITDNSGTSTVASNDLTTF